MLEKIGVREFKRNLAKYIDAVAPIAIIRHGQIVGYFIPAQPKPTEAEIAGLQRAAARLDLVLQEHDLSEDILVEEFRQLRKQGR